MTTASRWTQAQEYERGYWERVARRAAAGMFDQIDFYRWRAGEIQRRMTAVCPDALPNGASRIVEMGSGPVGVLPYLPGQERVAVDPLHEQYDRMPDLTQLRSAEVRYLASPGEQVPLPSGSYDLAIMENCIDHVRDMNAVMNELGRLLKPEGILYLTVNSRSRPGFWMHRVLANLRLDPGHPHTFTERRFLKLLDHHGYDVLSFETGDWFSSWREDLLAKNWKHRAKGILFVSEYLLTAVARKRA